LVRPGHLPQHVYAKAIIDMAVDFPLVSTTELSRLC